MNEDEINVIKQYKSERKGMCKRCYYSVTVSGDNWMRCAYYRSYCKLVARNCKGAK